MLRAAGTRQAPRGQLRSGRLHTACSDGGPLREHVDGSREPVAPPSDARGKCALEWERSWLLTQGSHVPVHVRHRADKKAGHGVQLCWHPKDPKTFLHFSFWHFNSVKKKSPSEDTPGAPPGNFWSCLCNVVRSLSFKSHTFLDETVDSLV